MLKYRDADSPLALSSAFSLQPSALRETLRATGALPAHVAGSFEEIAACHITPDDDYLVFDRRGHAVYRVAAEWRGRGEEAPADRRRARPDPEPDRLRVRVPTARSSWRTRLAGQERIQIFSYLGASLGGFMLPVRSVPRVTLGDLVLSGVGSVDYTSRSILVSQPDVTGALITEYAPDGRTLRTFGNPAEDRPRRPTRTCTLRSTAGCRWPSPEAGSTTSSSPGVPAFRKYDAEGKLLFERHIEGLEIDEHIRGLPTTWPRRKTSAGEFPLVPSAIRTAAVDPGGNLWISLASPHTYVYDTDGDKRRIVQFRGAGIVTPSDLFFTKNRPPDRRARLLYVFGKLIVLMTRSR